uniref:Uncharacterized protein n=1 Tax=Anguilla anguilla TaxID=7936 RepID=A0A0E9VWF9_ANGAN
MENVGRTIESNKRCYCLYLVTVRQIYPKFAEVDFVLFS